MAELKERIELGKSGLSLIRDASILSVIIALFAFPAWTNSRLFEAGVVNANLGVLTWSNKAKADALKIGEQIQKLTKENILLTEEIAKIRIANPALTGEFAVIEKQLADSARKLEQADDAVKASVVAQQTIIRKAAPSADQLNGWVYLGAIDQNRSGWVGKYNADAKWPLNAGETVILSDTVYLRADGQANKRSASKQIGVVRDGQKVRIQEIDASTHLKRSGWTVWARVSVE